MDDDPLAALTRFLDAATRRDRDTMVAGLLPGGQAVQSRDGALRQIPLAELPDRFLAVEGTIAEPLHDVLVHVDHDIAVVWAPYDAVVDGQVRHSGTNIVTLVHREGRWLIAGLTDNGRRPTAEPGT